MSPTLRSGAKGGRSHGKTNGTDRAALVVSHETGQGWWKESEVSGTLRAEGEGRPSRPSHVIAASLTSGGHPNSNTPGRRREDDVNLVTHSLRAEGFDASEDGTGRGTPLTVVGGGSFPTLTEDASPTLTDRRGDQTAVGLGAAVRRLTPLECERLQGLPDGWTSHDAEGKPLSDAARYRLIGNAVCVPVVQWIAGRIAFMDVVESS